MSPITYEGYIRRSSLDIKTVSVRRTLYLTLVRSQLCYGSQVWAPQSVKLIKRTERIQRRSTKYILDLPFFCDTSYNQRLAKLDLIPLCYWHEFLDMMFFFKCINGIIIINNDIMPKTQNRERTTRSADPECLLFILTRSARVWNVLPKDLTNINTTFNQFKNGLYNYYKLALTNIYNADDPRTWKSVCLTCNNSRNLSCSNSCCF